MKYLFLLSRHRWTGSARAFAVAATELAARGHKVVVVAPPDSVTERIVSKMAALAEVDSTGFKLLPFRLKSLWPASVLRLRGIIRQERVEVIYIHTNREHFIAALACMLAGRGKVVRRVSVGSAIGTHLFSRIGTALVSRLARSSFMFSAEQDMQASRVPNNVEKTGVVPVGVKETEHATPDSEYSFIACVYDGSARNSAAIAIRTLAKLKDRHPSLRLIMLGEGPYEDDLRMQAAALRVLNLVTFAGERDDSLEVMKRARLGWILTEGDTAAFSALDFMSVGVPVLTAESTVLDRYNLTGITGVQLSLKDANVVASLVSNTLADAETMSLMGEAARGRVQRYFSLVGMVDGFESMARV